MTEKIGTALATTRNAIVAKKKKVYKKPTPVKFLPRNNKFLGTCTFCGVQVGWATKPPCGKG